MTRRTAGGTHGYLSKRLKHYGIDTSHFQSIRRGYTKELLQEAVTASQSMAGILRHLRLGQAGGTRAHVARRIKAFGIDTSHFTGQAHNQGKAPAGKLAPRRSSWNALRKTGGFRGGGSARP
ncbi:hypothetical protein [Kitasatospora herbaricolor]|uniref:Uncharacterized protein n=1 Tax=Kitasatospora herbaricolor TaxID=68217 RepID=A0ABZ1WCV1_9ACTN|nr:hypothetical protein [Kitasatospora herbaricolor]